ncbi:death-on-curing protein [Pantoea sp. AN62]|uniref:type II toxin-antitoxin system death-on-curing family toxin n=1 Tax=Pantoea TaxID=53335 RepID=UPI000A25DEF5|nr:MULTISPECIES: type II toxin-antitoxin system death-on-curing family toxin [Pantoea]MCQ5472816.1 type II toxin-antitoxin system death-on-curing family toxin [Pantoea brenneri]MDU4748670.1 type II toxin-antitoxin system death-on-curing family toxin [Pantoea sp.]ORM54213.1 hypothetical protein HA39_17860 [Pantoea brenneri]OXM18676.1 hypothetical protein CBI35_21815 [Pantoea sp. AV62]
MSLLTAAEIIRIHDDILSRLAGVKGMADAGRAEAIATRIINRIEYEGMNDPFEVAAMYLVAIARGHIFNDGNKRTALYCCLMSLRRAGIGINPSETLVEMTVSAATGEYSPEQVAAVLRHLKK